MNIEHHQKGEKGISVTCLRSISCEELFKEALGDLYSHRYLMQNQNQFGSILFIFQIKTEQRCWSLFKDDKELRNYLKKHQNARSLSSSSLEALEKIEILSLEEQGKLFQSAITEVLKRNQGEVKQTFFDFDREGYRKFIMKKRSGGRYKQSTCCKFGAIFQRWKEREVAIFLKGVAYYKEKSQLREFLSFSQGFHFQFGKPSTGLELGLTLFANNRQLSLQCLSVKDFIYFLFILRSACKESCYMSLNRFNSFAPLRYASSAKYYIDGKDYFQALFEALDGATRSILITGWMLSPQFLLKRQSQKITLEDVLSKASFKGVSVKIILYHQTCFLSNGSQYCKNKLEQYKNISVLSHPCGKLPVLWSHHGKIVIVDETQAFVGGLDICYGRYDRPSHDLYPPSKQYPGLEHNNVRKNDQWDVKYPNELGISRHQCRLPWHDVAQNLKGDVVADLTHHFYQMWNFVRYENRLQPQDSPSMFETDVKTVFSTKVLPVQESELSSESGIFKRIQNRITSLKSKGKDFIKEMTVKIVGSQPSEQLSRVSSIRLSASQDYFAKYLKQIQTEIEQKKNTSVSRSLGKKKSRSRNSGNRSSRYSVQDVKKVKETLNVDPIKEEGPQKTNSFLLTGNKVIDFMAVDIDKDYVSCLERVKNKMKPSQEDGEIRQIQSDEEVSGYGSAALDNKSIQLHEGRDQCQVVRSVGNWSIGCHSSNTEFSIQIAYLQLISQAKHYIYIENQFFISSMANSKLVRNQIAQALYLRIKKAIQNNEKFIVYVILPLIPGFAGDLEAEDCLLLRKEMQWQYDTICRGQDSLYQKLLNHCNDPSKYIQFFGLRKHGKLKPDWIPQTQIIYVHSKLMIVDDEAIICGSANINDRSMLGDRDSEVAVVTRGEDFVEGKMDGEPVLVSQMAQELRIKLWMEHFGMSEQQVTDPVSDETYDFIANRAARNTKLYRKIFGCYPDDEMATRKDIQEVKRQQSNIELYDELSPKIQGHVVEFPLRFLEEQPLTCLMTEKEFYVPTQCLT